MNKNIVITMQLIFGVSSLLAMGIQPDQQLKPLKLSTKPWFHLSTEVTNLINIKEVGEELSIEEKRDKIVGFFVGMMKHPARFDYFNPRTQTHHTKEYLIKILSNEHTIKHMLNIIEINIGWTIIKKCGLQSQKINLLKHQQDEQLDQVLKQKLETKYLKQFSTRLSQLSNEDLKLFKHRAIIKACLQFISTNWSHLLLSDSKSKCDNTMGAPIKMARL